MDNDTNIARVLVPLARAFGYSVVGLCQTPWDASILKVPRLFCINMGDNKSISVGTLIKTELERQERSVVWFAQHLSCDRTNVYRIFAKDSIDTELLIRICKVLNHNFFADISNSVEHRLSRK